MNSQLLHDTQYLFIWSRMLWNFNTQALKVCLKQETHNGTASRIITWYLQFQRCLARHLCHPPDHPPNHHLQPMFSQIPQPWKYLTAQISQVMMNLLVRWRSLSMNLSALLWRQRRVEVSRSSLVSNMFYAGRLPVLDQCTLMARSLSVLEILISFSFPPPFRCCRIKPTFF